MVPTLQMCPGIGINDSEELKGELEQRQRWLRVLSLPMGLSICRICDTEHVSLQVQIAYHSSHEQLPLAYAVLYLTCVGKPGGAEVWPGALGGLPVNCWELAMQLCSRMPSLPL